MEQHFNNSFSAIEKEKEIERQKQEKIISGNVSMKKRSGFRSFMDDFWADDIGDVKSYIRKDVIIPNIKKLISELVSGSLDLLFYGERQNKKKTSPTTRVSYSSYYTTQSQPSPRVTARESISSYYLDDIIFDNRKDAEDVLVKLYELVDAYQCARVSDLNEFIGTDGNYTDVKYGWRNLNGACVRKVSDGWLLDLPPAIVL